MIVITGITMIAEIAAGVLFGSMALLADGLHMASHTLALAINAFAYVYARRHARDERFSFGTGKVNALGGFSSAVLLLVFALIMAWESVHRMLNPVDIAFNQAIFVAVLGLIVNGVSMAILGHRHDDHGGEDHAHDHNLRAAYLHVLADALTSILAVFALLAAKYSGQVWMDPLMGIIGAALVSRWALSLLRSTSGVLLDRQGPAETRAEIRKSIERDGDSRVADLHVWVIGPGVHAAIVSVVAHTPRSPEHYGGQLPPELGLGHVTVEVHQCAERGPDREPDSQQGRNLEQAATRSVSR